MSLIVGCKSPKAWIAQRANTLLLHLLRMALPVYKCENNYLDASPPVSSELIREIVNRLEDRYGQPLWRERQDPVDELISCILSQHTSDINSLRAFADLKAAYPSWAAVIAAPVGRLSQT